MSSESIRIRFADGRRAAIGAIDAMLSNPTNIQKFKDECQELFDASPMQFFKDFVLPITPKTVIEESAGEGDSSPEALAERARNALEGMDIRTTGRNGYISNGHGDEEDDGVRSSE